MKMIKNILQSIIFIGAFIPIVGLTTNDSSEPTKKESNSGDCVKISKWKNCSNLCTDAICYQFKNDCTSKVKITFNTKNTDGSWTKHELTLEVNEESDEGMICPYIAMKWSYVQL